jgi:NhaP-type Na+/H+ or K+/H+ antiporter
VSALRLALTVPQSGNAGLALSRRSKTAIMSAVPFDTLKFARHLEASGMAASVAAGAAEALADALTGAALATRSDLAETTRELSNEISAVRSEIGATRTELKHDIELSRRDITIKFGSMLVLAVGILLTAIRYLPPHP